MIKVSIILLFVVLLGSCKELPKCTDVHEGEFTIQYDDTSIPESYMSRSGSQQIEKIAGIDTIRQNIKWIDDCAYKIIDQTDMSKFPVVVQITEISNLGYKFYMYLEAHPDDIHKGVAIKF